MSTMHFSRPKSAQPWVPTSEQQNQAGARSSISRHTDKHVQSGSLISSCVSPREMHARQADGLAPSCHSNAQECSTARQASAYPAPCNAACEAEGAVAQSSGLVVDDENNSREVHLQHVGTACLPESSSSAFSRDTSRRLSSREATTCREGSSLQQADSRRQSGVQAGSHLRRNQGRQQEWPPQGARWRSVALYKLQAPPMHLPTAKEGVMGRMQCLQSAVSAPAHWSISSTRLHARPRTDAVKLKGHLHIPYNVSQ
ncbi:hypothetical protein ABBQ32_001307 [Trebouxia sp. C0010 RCD-2024]